MSCIRFWYPHKLAFALGTYVGVGRFGNVASNLVIPFLYNWTRQVAWGTWAAFGVSVGIFCCSMVLARAEMNVKSHTSTSVFAFSY